MVSNIIPFDRDVMKRREELNFSRIAGVQVVRTIPDVQIAILFEDANDTVDAKWLFRLEVTARVFLQWRTFRVTQIADVDDLSVTVTLARMGYSNDDATLDRVPPSSVLVESNGCRALFGPTGRLPLTP